MTRRRNRKTKQPPKRQQGRNGGSSLARLASEHDPENPLSPQAIMAHFSEVGSDHDRDWSNDRAGNQHIPLWRGWKALINKRMYSIARNAALRQYLYGLPDPSTALAQDSDAYEVCLRDPVVRQSEEISRRGGAGRTWRFNPHVKDKPNRKLSEVLTQLFRKIDDFGEARYNFAAAKLRGSAYGYLETDERWCKIGDKSALWTVPHRIVDVDPRNVAVQYDSENNTYFLSLLPKFATVPVRIPDEWPFFAMVYGNEEARLGYGRPLLDSLILPVYKKKIIEQQVIDAVELFAGGGILVAKIDTATNLSNEAYADRVDDMSAALRAILKGHNTLVLSKDDEFNIVPGDGAAISHGLELIRYYDETIRNLILGSDLPHGGGGGESNPGSFALSKTQQETTDDQRAADWEKQGTTIKQMAEWLRLRNASILMEMGIGPEIETPDCIVNSADRANITDIATAAKTFQDIGLALSQSQLYELTGFEAPLDENDVLKPVQQRPGQSPQQGLMDAMGLPSGEQPMLTDAGQDVDGLGDEQGIEPEIELGPGDEDYDMVADGMAELDNAGIPGLTIPVEEDAEEVQ